MGGEHHGERPERQRGLLGGDLQRITSRAELGLVCGERGVVAGGEHDGLLHAHGVDRQFVLPRRREGQEGQK